MHKETCNGGLKIHIRKIIVAIVIKPNLERDGNLWEKEKYASLYSTISTYTFFSEKKFWER